MTADRDEWDADSAADFCEAVRERLAPIVKAEWTDRRVKREVEDELRLGTETHRSNTPSVALSRECLLAKWRDRAEEFRHVDARVEAAALCDAFVRDLDALDLRLEREGLTLDQASEISGTAPPSSGVS